MILETNDFTYFPTKELNPIEFTRNFVTVIIDFDLHAMFNVSKDFEAWTKEFDFQHTFYSKSSSYTINSKLKKDSFLTYKLLYKSNDFNITLNFETFGDMPKGIMQLETVGLSETSSLLGRLKLFCEELESSIDNTEPFLDKRHEKPGDEEEVEVLIPKEKEQSQIERLISNHHAEINIKGRVYYYSVTHDSVIIGEMNPIDIYSGGTKEIFFENFLNNNEEHDFIRTYFGDLFLQETIKIVNQKNDSLRVKEILKPKNLSYRNDTHEPLVYVFEVNDNNISIGEFNRMNRHSGGGKDISFKDFIDNKSGHGFVTSYFDEKVLNEAIEFVKAKLAMNNPIKENPELRPNYFEKVTDSAVYYVEISEDSILIGTSGKSSYFGDSASKISFDDFINKNEGKSFIKSYFDEQIAEKIIKKIEDKYSAVKVEKNRLIHEVSYFEKVDGSNVYFFKINDSNVTIGEYNRMNTQGGGAKDISFKEFIDEKYEQDFVSGIFGKSVLEKAIKMIKERM